jgi:hypothetical protein
MGKTKIKFIDHKTNNTYKIIFYSSSMIKIKKNNNMNIEYRI